MALLAGLIGGGLLFRFNPAQHGFYPHCVFHAVTGLQCPGCGGLRAVHQLLHGNLVAAAHFNVLVVIAFPLGIWAAWRELTGAGLSLRPRWVWLLGMLLLGFGILRNLPGFGWLSP